MALFAKDLEGYFACDKLSDVTLILNEEGGRKRKRNSEVGQADAITLPGHSMVLLAHSGFCATKLEHWSSNNAASASNSSGHKHSIELSVPAGQLDLAQRLVKGMYQQQPLYTDMNPAQLVQLLLLTDRYEVPKVQAAVLNALEAAPKSDWPWQTVLDVLGLPVVCREQEGFKAVVETAASILQEQLGDLELVWADDELEQQLLALPFTALLQLIQSDQTRVASEHTVVYTIMCWYYHELGRTVQQLKQLMQQVRMQHCSRLYILTNMMQDQTVLKCFSPFELAVASLCATESHLQALEDVECSVLGQYRSWRAPCRPMSSRPQILEWKLPLAELQVEVEMYLKDKSPRKYSSATHVLQGQGMFLVLTIKQHDLDEQDGRSQDGAEPTTDLMLSLALDDNNDGVRDIKVEFSALAVTPSKTVCETLQNGFSCETYWGLEAFIHLGVVDSWPSICSVLRGKGLVHPDACLHLQGKLLEMW